MLEHPRVGLKLSPLGIFLKIQDGRQNGFRYRNYIIVSTSYAREACNTSNRDFGICSIDISRLESWIIVM